MSASTQSRNDKLTSLRQPDNFLDSPDKTGDALYRKLTLRLMPLLFLGYLFAFLDRINIGYAQLQMKTMLGFSDPVYGVGAGIFFISYVFFEIPSNLWIERSGVRFTLGRIMVLWGLTSAGTMFVTTPDQFYAARFLLALFEAGFFPGIILYLTFWYPDARQGRVTSLFMLAIPVAGMLGGPLSGWIMSALNMKHQLAGWQWMLLLEGLPTALLGLICYFYFADGPEKAGWLTEAECAQVVGAIKSEGGGRKAEHSDGVSFATSPRAGLALLSQGRVWVLAFAYFATACANYTFTFWLPTMLRAIGIQSIARIGWYSAIPYCFATAGALAIAGSSDRRKERRWHVAGSLGLAAIALASTTLIHGSIFATLFLLSVGAFFQFGAGILFWALPPTHLKGKTAASGVAIVSSIGVIGGFVSPALLGWIKDYTGKLDAGILAICLIMMSGSIAILFALPRESDSME